MDGPELGEVRSIDRPWGTEEVFADVAGRFVGKILHVRSGARLELPLAEHSEEVISLMSGAVTVELGDSAEELMRIAMVPGQTVHIKAGSVHQIQADEDSMLLEVSSDTHSANMEGS